MMPELLKKTLIDTHGRYNRVVHRMPNRYERLMRLVARARPRTLLEIGVWNGRHARRMIETALDARPGQGVEYHGFDLFESADAERIREEVGKMPPSRDEVRALLADLAERGAAIHLHAGDTTRTLPEAVPSLPRIDFAFIDGGHSYETVRSDWHAVERLLHPRSVVVIDDYVNPEAIRHENWGVNRLVDEIDRDHFRVELLSPIDWWAKPWGVLKNRLALVVPRENASVHGFVTSKHHEAGEADGE